MPDIFGRNALDYQHLRDMHSEAATVLNTYLQNQASGGQRHDFAALRRFANEEAQPVGYLTDNLQAIQSLVEEVLYTDFRLDDFVPIVTNIPEGAKTYSYRVMDRVGQGRFIDNDGSNAPSANVSLSMVAYTLEYAGIVPEWTREDVRAAMFGGVALDTETVRAATTGAMDHIEEVGLRGDGARGFTGLINQDTGTGGVSRSDATSTISSMTGDEIVEFLQDQVTSIVTDSAETFGRSIRAGLSIYLPLEQGAKVNDTRLTDIDRTAWEYFVEHNLWFTYTGERPQLRLVAELDQAGDSDTDRMIVALMNDRIMEMAMPISPRVIGMYDRGGYSFAAPMEYKISGLNLKRPTGVRYVDGI